MHAAAKARAHRRTRPTRPDPDDEPSAEELAEIAARKAAIDARARARFLRGGRFTRSAYTRPDPARGPATDAEAARRAIRDFRRLGRPLADHDHDPDEETPVSTTATAGPNGTAAAADPDPPTFTCFECGHPLDERGRCRHAGCSRSRDRGLRPPRGPAKAAAAPPPPAPEPGPEPGPAEESRFAGVYRAAASKPHPWLAATAEDGKLRPLGYFPTDVEAARAYDAARARAGLPAVNFPGEAPAPPADPPAPAPEAAPEPARKSRYTGVTTSASRSLPWRAQIAADGTVKHLGRFATEEEAARAFDAAKVAQGKPPVNFPADAPAAPVAAPEPERPPIMATRRTPPSGPVVAAAAVVPPAPAPEPEGPDPMIARARALFDARPPVPEDDPTTIHQDSLMQRNTRKSSANPDSMHSPALRRLDAARRVAEALDGLDAADVRAALEIVGLVLDSGGPAA